MKPNTKFLTPTTNRMDFFTSSHFFPGPTRIPPLAEEQKLEESNTCGCGPKSPEHEPETSPVFQQFTASVVLDCTVSWATVANRYTPCGWHEITEDSADEETKGEDVQQFPS
ncbi:unnamed protein product [Dovyalis caffra]|uniref:Uncharacterized protein n=1 Tax=Dovyalis caffra TaxID=77055 RepID=A0AAV1QWD1_9ROSI|nr:unnamed protein product [Dovyalis caffra]